MVSILVCPDKFKGSLTAWQVCEAVEKGLRLSNTNVHIKKLPLADGGEGTFDLFLRYFKATIVRAKVHDPLFRQIVCEYGISEDGSTAFIEMAKASGLQLVERERRNPLYTTSLGTGELIADALMRNVTRVVLGIGGSATNDAGIGMAHALGFRFLDAANDELKPIGQNLERISRIARSNQTNLLHMTEFVVLSDVQNPLFGKEGAAFVYGPQKGASPHAVSKLDKGLINFAAVASKDLKVTPNFPGAGAAGGLGSGAKVFLNAKVISGINYVFEFTRIEESMRDVDVVVTGEGKVDAQSLFGKVTGEVTKLAKRLNKRVILCCGKCELDVEQLRALGADEVVSLVDNETPEAIAVNNAAEVLASKISILSLIKN